MCTVLGKVTTKYLLYYFGRTFYCSTYVFWRKAICSTLWMAMFQISAAKHLRAQTAKALNTFYVLKSQRHTHTYIRTYVATESQRQKSSKFSVFTRVAAKYVIKENGS